MSALRTARPPGDSSGRLVPGASTGFVEHRPLVDLNDLLVSHVDVAEESSCTYLARIVTGQRNASAS